MIGRLGPRRNPSSWTSRLSSSASVRSEKVSLVRPGSPQHACRKRSLQRIGFVISGVDPASASMSSSFNAPKGTFAQGSGACIRDVGVRAAGERCFAR